MLTDSNTKEYENSITIIDELFEDLSEISGMEEFANTLDDLVSLIDSDELEQDKIFEKGKEVLEIYNKEVSWRKDATNNLLPELEKYNLVIKNNIGLETPISSDKKSKQSM